MNKKEFGIKLGDQSKILNKEEWSGHGIIYSTTTTNLDLYLTYIQEQLLKQKSGFIYINCVPDMERRIQMKEVCKSIGKENDFYTLDFNIKNESNSINIFNENKDIVNDDLKDILNQFAEKFSSTSDITIYDVIKNNKILYISLPVIASQEQKDTLGKEIVAQIYSAYERLQNETLMEVPYSIFLDGHTYKYVSVDMLSQLRSKSLGFYFITQSLICDGIEANVENKIVLKIVDSNLIEKIIENNDTYNEQNKVFDLNDIMDLKLCKCFTKDKHNKFIKNDFYSVLDSSYIECKMMNLI